jgi:hypothetical protein
MLRRLRASDSVCLLLAASQALPNDPSHQYRLGVATDVPAFTDGKEHTVRVNYTTPVRSAA